ncbi:MAG TPA: MFS transporter [Rhabdochlamydiaceae bacterium]|nr:MFS transporter [Rhabdochlamydiaceae bacterium]
MPGFSQPVRYSLVFLNLTQFLGALNDNLFKLAVAFLLIHAAGAEKASSILSAAGAIFVIPFLLFSSTAGVLADRFSKQSMILIMKAVEVGIMFLALFAFSFKSSWASFSLLFLLSTHSALFGPSKYAIIPEIVPAEAVSRANGLITSFTYLAIILGTFLASFLTEVTNSNFVQVAGCCLLIAMIGFLSAFGIKKTPSQGSEKKISLFFLKEIYQTLVFCKQRKHLTSAILGSSYFLLIGAFVQLNIIPFGIQSLQLSPAAGGYLFLSSALGIAFGSILGGKFSRKQLEPGLSCLAGFLMAFLLLLIDLFSTNLALCVIFLIFLGIFGGIFIVPLNAFTQMNSSDEKRGQVIATANFLSFIGVLLASFALYFFSQIIGISSARGFGIMGLITLIVSFFMACRMSDVFLSFLGRKIIRKIYKVQAKNVEIFQQSSSPILILQDATWKKAFILTALIPNVQFFVIRQNARRFPWFENLFHSIHLVPNEMKCEKILKEAIPCIFLRKGTAPQNGYENREMISAHIDQFSIRSFSIFFKSLQIE